MATPDTPPARSPDDLAALRLSIPPDAVVWTQPGPNDQDFIFGELPEEPSTPTAEP